jgi:hypothetical protein
VNCHNCQAPLTGPFCAACGQKAAPLELSLHDFFHELAHEILHVDGRIVQSIRRLVLSPGFLTREYVLGRRTGWVSPVRLYLLFSLIFFALTLSHSAVHVSSQSSADDAHAVQAARTLGFNSLDELRSRVEEVLHTWAPRMMFALVPLFAWMVRVAFRRSHRTFLQHLYFALHVHAAWFALGALTVAARLTMPSSVFPAIRFVCVAYGIAYVVFAMRRAYDIPVRLAVIRAALVLPAYAVAVALGTATALLPVFLPVVMRQLTTKPTTNN